MADLFFILLVFGGIFLGIPGLMAWLCLFLQRRILRRMGYRNAPKILRFIEFVVVFGFVHVILNLWARSMLHAVPAPV